MLLTKAALHLHRRSLITALLHGYADEGDVAAAASAWGFDGLAADATAKDFFLAIAEKYDWNFASHGS